MPKLLKNIEVNFASLVDEPANPHARILLYKRADDVTKYIREEGGEYCVYSKDGDKIACHGTRAEALAQLRAIEANKALEKIGRKVSGARLGALKQAIKALKMAMDGLETEDDQDEDEKDKEVSMSKKELLQKQEPPEEPDDTPAPSEPEPEESVSKAAFVALQKQLAETQAIAKAERDARLTTEHIQKARAEYPEVGDPVAIGAIMKRATESLPAEDVTELTRVLKAASEQLRQSALFTEVGRSGAKGEVSATETLMKMATELQEQGKATNFGEALNKIASDPANGRLFADYRTEQLRRS